MSDIIGIFTPDSVEYFTTGGTPIKPRDIPKGKLIAVLCDEYFFFFQTEIASKRKARLTVMAYAKSNFPIDGYVGYLKGSLPLIGYIAFSDRIPETTRRILRKAKIITSPFALTYVAEKKRSFIYNYGDICAACRDGRLLYYTKGDACELKQRDSNIENLPLINPDKNRIVELAARLIEEKRIRAAHLPIDGSSAGVLDEIKPMKFVLIGFFTLVVIAANILKYEAYKRQLNGIRTKLNMLYLKALGNKHYSDPFGVLLYKASVSNAEGSSSSPLSVLYRLSKAKDGFRITIDRIEFANGNLKIEGVTDNYANLARYVEAANRLLGKKLIIQNTQATKNGLSFVLTEGTG